MKRFVMIFSFMIIIFQITPITSASSQAENKNRIALVIGNGAYKTSPLLNPANDADDMAKALETCGFDVIKVVNADRLKMRNAVRRFGDEITKGTVALFFFAGHGIQVEGENYLVPIGVDVMREDEVPDECLRVSSVLRKMQTAGNRLNIIILDACRNNPFRSYYRSSNRGLARMDAPKGSILSYATAPGSVAMDGARDNGLYTSMLLKHMRTPGMKLEEVFKNVRIDVAASSNDQQIPWESSSLMGNFYFLQEKQGAVSKADNTTDESDELKNLKTTLKEQKRKIDVLQKQKVALGENPNQKPTVSPDGRFIAFGNGVVRDKREGLEWIVVSEQATNWKVARNLINKLSDEEPEWRMPLKGELRTIRDLTNKIDKINPMIQVPVNKIWTGLRDPARRKTSGYAYDFETGSYWKDTSIVNENQKYSAVAVRTVENN